MVKGIAGSMVEVNCNRVWQVMLWHSSTSSELLE